MSKFGYSKPIYLSIVETLQKKQGSITDLELYKGLKADDDNLSFTSFNKALMTLEIEGIIHVYNLTKNKRGVEFVKN